MFQKYKYYFSIGQLLKDQCPKVLCRKYRNLLNISLKSDLWSEESKMSGNIQFDIRIQKKNIVESKIYIRIPDLNLDLIAKPEIGEDQSIIDYLTNINEIEFKNGNSIYITEIDNFIIDIDPVLNISPGLSFGITFVL